MPNCLHLSVFADFLLACKRGSLKNELCEFHMLKRRVQSSSFSFLGEKSSRDEQVACAMLATQLDNFLGGDPVQHRQVQGYESPEFMNLFPRGVSYKVRCEIM